MLNICPTFYVLGTFYQYGCILWIPTTPSLVDISQYLPVVGITSCLLHRLNLYRTNFWERHRQIKRATVTPKKFWESESNTLNQTRHSFNDHQQQLVHLERSSSLLKWDIMLRNFTVVVRQ